MTNQTPVEETEISRIEEPVHRSRVPPTTPRPVSFWNRYSVIINFSLDALLLVIFLVQAWILSVLRFVFPRGAGREWTVWGATSVDWTEALCGTYVIFAVAVLVHVMLHWTWVCGVVSARLMGRKVTKDDGSQTLVGVGLIVFLVHVFIGGILVAKSGLVGPL